MCYARLMPVSIFIMVQMVIYILSLAILTFILFGFELMNIISGEMRTQMMFTTCWKRTFTNRTMGIQEHQLVSILMLLGSLATIIVMKDTKGFLRKSLNFLTSGLSLFGQVCLTEWIPLPTLNCWMEHCQNSIAMLIQNTTANQKHASKYFYHALRK